MTPTTDRRAQTRDLLGLRRIEDYQTVSVREEPGERIDGLELVHLTFTTNDQDTIPALLLKPQHGNGAALIAVHQHGGDFPLGKSEVAGIAGAASLAYGRRLALEGFTVLMPDMAGFEGRQRGPAAEGRDDEQFDAFVRVTEGSSLQAKHSADIAALTTWLLEQPYSGDTIGIIGHSLGGQIAFFSLAVDSRISVGVISCGLGTVESLNDQGIRHNAGWYVPGIIAFGDTTAVAGGVSDQKVLVLAGTDDPLFPIEGIKAALSGFETDSCEVIFAETGHSFTQDGMTQAISHFARHLVQ